MNCIGRAIYYKSLNFEFKQFITVRDSWPILLPNESLNRIRPQVQGMIDSRDITLAISASGAPVSNQTLSENSISFDIFSDNNL